MLADARDVVEQQSATRLRRAGLLRPTLDGLEPGQRRTR
jgi:hypothetical protein